MSWTATTRSMAPEERSTITSWAAYENVEWMRKDALRLREIGLERFRALGPVFPKEVFGMQELMLTVWVY